MGTVTADDVISVFTAVIPPVVWGSISVVEMKGVDRPRALSCSGVSSVEPVVDVVGVVIGTATVEVTAGGSVTSFVRDVVALTVSVVVEIGSLSEG